MPTRIGGFDQIEPNSTPVGTSSGVTTRTFVIAFAAAFDLHSSRARSFTSTAHTVTAGDRRAMVSAIGPAPQPRSSASPVDTSGGSDRRSNEVPASS